MRGARSPRSVATILAIAVVAVGVALLVARLPRETSAVGMLDECDWNWPIVALEGDEWRRAVPDDLHGGPLRELPVLAWPSGLRFDDAAGTVLDADDHIVFRSGDRVRVRGTIVDMREGDIPPCFAALGLRIETIAAAP